MPSYRIEVQNVTISENKEMIKRTACTNMLCIPVFIIPGIECPFRGLGLDHTHGGRT